MEFLAMALEGTEPESSPGPSTKWREHLNIRQMDSGENKRQPPVSRKRCTDTTEISSASRSSAPVLTFGGGSGFLADGHSKAHPFSSSALPRRTDDPTAVLCSQNRSFFRPNFGRRDPIQPGLGAGGGGPLDVSSQSKMSRNNSLTNISLPKPQVELHIFQSLNEKNTFDKSTE